MTAPADAAQQLLAALALGAALGLIYGFLRPLRPRLTALADGVFVVCMAAAWIYLGFGICGGDLRLGYLAGMLLGALVLDRTLGRLLRPLFFGFWRPVGWFFPCRDGLLKNFLKFFAKMQKNPLHI